VSVLLGGGAYPSAESTFSARRWWSIEGGSLGGVGQRILSSQRPFQCVISLPAYRMCGRILNAPQSYCLFIAITPHDFKKCYEQQLFSFLKHEPNVARISK
jgi:hypothetical protein